MTTLTLPSLLIVNSTSYHHHLIEDGGKSITNFEDINDILNAVLNQSIAVSQL
jgi:hypothetical protein